VVVVSFFAKVRGVAGMVAAVAGLTFANPVLANSSANADVAAPLRAQQAAKAPQGGDEEFRRLFNGWKQMDGPQFAIAPTKVATAPVMSGTAAAAVFNPTRVSIPSRMPVEGSSLTSSYGMRVHPVLGGRRAHKGVDLAMPVGTPVYATADGVIGRADWFSSYGLYVAIEHGGNIQTRYGHMSRLNVAAGQQVHKGDIIGYVGTTGRSTGPHLHYEVRIAGVAVNPVPYMNGATRVLPTATTVVAMGGGDEND
jgi:murein DD-endopeptidase MepM/ murein hydrolase activator NlpD